MTTRRHGMFTKAYPNWHNAGSACYIYGSNSEGIDTGKIIEGEGVLFLSAAAIQEMAEVMGWEVNTDWAETQRKLEEDVAWERHRNEVLQAENDEMRRDLDTFGRLLAATRAEP